LIHSQLPELRVESDLDYIKTSLFLDRTEPEAVECFRELIAECLRGEWSTQINWYIHNLKHH